MLASRFVEGTVEQKLQHRISSDGGSSCDPTIPHDVAVSERIFLVSSVGLVTSSHTCESVKAE